MKIRFPDENRAGLSQQRDRGAVAIGHVPFADARRRGRRHATDVKDVLDRDRHAVERTSIATGGEFRVEFTRLTPSFVGHTSVNALSDRVSRTAQGGLDGFGGCRFAGPQARPNSSKRIT